jgi:hypothetical protein
VTGTLRPTCKENADTRPFVSADSIATADNVAAPPL